jgi:hypothetical protein
MIGIASGLTTLLSPEQVLPLERTSIFLSFLMLSSRHTLCGFNLIIQQLLGSLVPL